MLPRDVAKLQKEDGVSSQTHMIQMHMGIYLNSHVDSLTGLESAFKGETRRIITVDLVSIPSYEIHQEFVLCNIELDGSNYRVYVP